MLRRVGSAGVLTRRIKTWSRDLRTWELHERIGEEMVEEKESVIRWNHIAGLYFDWRNIRAVWIGLGLAALITETIIFLAAVGSIKNKLEFFGILLAVFFGILFVVLLCYWFLAWLQGGVHERLYTLEGNILSEERVPHKTWRMKIVRAIVPFMMLFATRPGQALALRRLLYDKDNQKKSVDLTKVKNLAENKANGIITLKTHSNDFEIRISSADFDMVADEIKARLLKKTSSRKKRKAPTSAENT